MKEELNTENKSTPKILAIGGGKGGAGKSVFSTIMAFWLARIGKRTVLMDVDLGGANLHTLLGIKSPDRTLNDFITRRFGELEDICIDTSEKNLRLISGASDVLSLANPHFSQKIKLMTHLSRLDADYVVLDLGAGTSFNVLDFFLIAHKKIIVLTPEPTSIQNAYIFVRNAVYRKLSRLSNKNPSLQALIKIAMDPKNVLKIRTIKELFQFIEESNEKNIIEILRKEIGDIHLGIVTNMVKNEKEENAGRIVKIVAEKYLTIPSTDLGCVSFDKHIRTMVSDMIPLTNLDQSSQAFGNIYEIANKLSRD
ncbi:MAG: P-loop NTPase [Desulfobacteraceae bacterium]|nr:P-loop NTPase [Desulfobacteraceae bacterium]MDH3573956.1 P-loop NTPase [Desulfobacteraceae bacterium]MDH3722214.1 P-loop NTPase [Desulfobacteraceae bacterium]MDH3836388.1 P-loop NTPase [Desulfobacteraceae bacterium]MDH3874240.1 P-loop NTPase [Desulfobacteraceae bacterium]